MDEYPMICTELPGNGLARASVGFTCFWPRTPPLYAPSFAALLGRAKGVSSVFEAVDRACAVQVRRRLARASPFSTSACLALQVSRRQRRGKEAKPSEHPSKGAIHRGSA